MRLFTTRQARTLFLGWAAIMLAASLAACSCGDPGIGPDKPPVTPKDKDTIKAVQCKAFTRGLVVPIQQDTIHIRSVAWDTTGDHFATVSQDGRVQIRDAKTGIIETSMRYEVLSDVWRVAFVPGTSDEVLTVGLDGPVRRWKEGKEIASLLPPKSGLTSKSFAVAAIEQSGKKVPFLVTGYISEDGTGMVVWRSLDESVGLSARANTDKAVTQVALSADGLLTAVGFADGGVALYNSLTGALLGAVKGAHKVAIDAIAIDNEKKAMVSGGADTLMKIFDISNPKEPKLVQTIDKHLYGISSLSFSPSNKFLATTSMSKEDGLIGEFRVWNTSSLAEGKITFTEVSKPLFDRKVGAWQLAWHPDTKTNRLILGHHSGQAIQWTIDGAPQFFLADDQKSPVSSLEQSPDDKKWLVGMANGNVNVRDVFRKTINVTHNFPAAVTRVRWERDRQDVFVTLANGEVHRWDWREDKVLSTYTGDTPAKALAVRRDGRAIVVGYEDGSLVLLSTSDLSKPLVRWGAKHKGAILDVAWSNDGTWLVTASADGKAIVWDYNVSEKTLTQRQELTNGNKAPTRVSVSADDAKVAVGYLGGQVGIWTQATKAWKVFTGKYPTSLVRWLNIDTNVLLSAALPSDSLNKTDSRVHMWDLTDASKAVHSGVVDAGKDNHTNGMTDVVPNWNDQSLATSSNDGTYRHWRLRRAYPTRATYYTNRPTSLAARQDGAQVLTGTTGSLVHMYNYAIAETPTVRMLNGHNQSVGQMMFVNNGDQLLTSATDGRLLQWDVTSFDPKIMNTFPSTKSTFKPFTQIAGMSISPDQTRAVMAGDELLPSDQAAVRGRIAIWDLQNPDAPKHFLEGIYSLSSVIWHPSRELIVTAHRNGSVQTWEKTGSTWQSTNIFQEMHALTAGSLDIEKTEGKLAVSVGTLGDIRVWQLADGKQVFRFDSGGARVSRVVFHPAGHLLAAALNNGRVLIWSLETGALLLALEDPDLKQAGIFQTAHQGGAISLSWSADGKTLFTSGVDMNIKKWECTDNP